MAREGEQEPTLPPGAFAGRAVVIFDVSGKRELARVAIGSDGGFRIGLPEVVYQVDINHLGIDRAAGLPAQVQIRPGETTWLDIEIDTGIR